MNQILGPAAKETRLLIAELEAAIAEVVAVRRAVAEVTAEVRSEREAVAA